MKKTILICLLVLVIGLAIVIPIPIKIKQIKKFNDLNTINNDQQEEHKDIKTIDSINEYKGNIPEFSFKISGLVSNIVNSSSIKGKIPLYQFDAWTYDFYSTNKNTYVGFKYSDLIELLNIKGYNEAVFSSNRKSAWYLPEELDEYGTFIVFYRDGKKINDTDITFLTLNYRYGYSIEGLTEIQFN